MIRLLALGLLLAPIASAHVPTFNEAGASLATAFEIDNPTKSWVFYDELSGDEQNWFRFHLDAGDELFASLSLPPDEPGRPQLWILGPGLNGTGPARTPDGLRGQQAEPRNALGVEPFSPLAMRSTAEWRERATDSGTYYVVVQGESTYSLAIGSRESFTPVEWLTIPIERIAIQQWGGVPWPFAILGEVLGLGAAIWYARRKSLELRATVGVVGAGIIAGTAATTLLLAAIAVSKANLTIGIIIPIAFAFAAFGVGYAAFRAVSRPAQWWVAMLWAGAGLVIWAGMLIGPAILAGWAGWQGFASRQAR
jgi:hypothetical protein